MEFFISSASDCLSNDTLINNYSNILKSYNFRKITNGYAKGFSSEFGGLIEIDSLKFLLDLQEKLKNPIILNNKEIIIYDDYIE